MRSKSIIADARVTDALLRDAADQIRSFVSSDLFAIAANTAFGATSATLTAAIRDFERKGWPKLVLLDEQELHGARAAYSSDTDTIYLSRSFVASASSSAVTAVIVEEIGHALDARINKTDSAGDEGAIFSQHVLGRTLSAAELSALKAENDQGTIVVDGRTISAELAAPVVGTVTLDGSLADWTVNDQIDKTMSVSGYDLYAKATGASYVFAIKAPVAVGANTTVWLNTDQNASTGYQIWGWAGGAEYNINFDSSGTPRLYTGADGQTLVSAEAISYGFSADRTVVEFAVASSALGSPSKLNTLWDVNNATFLPTDFSSSQYAVSAAAPSPAPVVGSVTVDGNLADWTAADAIDKTLSTTGYDLYAKATGGSFAFAVLAPTAIGADTTVWLNTDQNTATGYKIWGWAGGAEYNINFDATGTPRLYTGADGQTLVNVPVSFAYSADRTAVEFTLAASAIGSPRAINTLWDINNSTFLPTDYGGVQFEVLNTDALPARTDFAKQIGIVYSETTAAKYFSTMAYSQLFMAAQSQAAMAGVRYDILTEADLTDLSKLANYDALLFPGLQNVKGSQVSAIENTLKILVEQYKVGLIAAGNFMTSDENGAALPGDSYARMKTLFDLAPVGGGFPANVTVTAADIGHAMMQDYTAGELIHTYTGAGWQAFAPVTAAGTNVLATQNVGGVTYNSVISTTTGGRNVHFSTDGVMADNNLLWQAVDYAVNGGGVTAGLQLSRNASVVAMRNDMDQAMEHADVDPDNGAPGIYDKLLPILQQWKTEYNFVGSYYVDIGDNVAEDQLTDWTVSGQYYKQLIDMGNELGSHSLSHPHDTNLLTAAQIQYEFQQSKAIIEQQMSQILGRPYALEGAAVPGAPENLATALSIIQYYDYLSGGFSSVGAGYPNAFGYLNPAMAAADKQYLAPNVKFDFSLVEFQGMTPAQASAEWAREFAEHSSHADVPIMLWPVHDYAEAMWSTDAPSSSPYTTQMFTDFIAQAYAAGSEFVTLADLAERMSDFNDSTIRWSISGNTVTATVTSPDAGKFALDLDNLGTQKIASVANWYAYDDDSVLLAKNGGTFTITLGTTAADVTHITALPMRSELLSLSGNGTNLNFSLMGEGDVVVDLQAPAGQIVTVTGGTIRSLVGEIMTIDVGAYGQHNVAVTYAANAAPVISSNGGGASAAISFAENSTSAVTTVKATDSNAGQALSYEIAGGVDAAKFAIDAATGVLGFKVAPDFETRTDSGANNVYDVVVGARDGSGGLDTQALAVTVTNVGGLTINGTSAANTLSGAGEEDTISGVGGNDVLNGLGGNDTLLGGDGADTLNGGDGRDTLNGGASNDVLVGGLGPDTLTGGTGRDRFDFNAIGEGGDTITDFARGGKGDILDIRDVLVGYRAGSSSIGAFVKLSGTTSTTVSVNADGIGTDFVALATLSNVAMSSNLLNDLVNQGNLVL